jgi:putative membrane protein
MVNLVMKLLVNGFGVWVAAMVVPGVVVESFVNAVIVAVVLGVVNMFVRPVLIILTLPVTILTLGLFLLILNALMVGLAGWLVPGFTVAGLGSAVLFSIVLWMVNGVLEMMTRDRRKV